MEGEFHGILHFCFACSHFGYLPVVVDPGNIWIAGSDNPPSLNRKIGRFILRLQPQICAWMQ
jgi:hypothetical protein